MNQLQLCSSMLGIKIENDPNATSDPTGNATCSNHRTGVTAKAVPNRHVLLSQILECSFSILSIGNGRDSATVYMHGPEEQCLSCHLFVRVTWVSPPPAFPRCTQPRAASFQPSPAFFPHLISVPLFLLTQVSLSA